MVIWKGLVWKGKIIHEIKPSIYLCEFEYNRCKFILEVNGRLFSYRIGKSVEIPIGFIMNERRFLFFRMNRTYKTGEEDTPLSKLVRFRLKEVRI